MPFTYEKKPETLCAEQYLGESTNSLEITEWALENGADAVWYEMSEYNPTGLRIRVGQTVSIFSKGDYVVLLSEGSFVQANSEYFESTYREVTT